MHCRTIISLVTAFCLLSLTSLVRAQSIAPTISYQGIISNGEVPASGEHHISVSFWSAETGGSQLWADDYTTQLTRGVFNLSLGSNKPLPSPSELDKPVWIAVAIDDGPPATRSRLTAVPMAMNVADGAVTSSKMGTDYVSSISLNGERISGKGIELNIVVSNGITASVDPGSSTLMLSLEKSVKQKGSSSQSVYDNPCGTNTDDYSSTWINTNIVGGGCGNRSVAHASTSSHGDGYSSILGGDSNWAFNFGARIGGGQFNNAGSFIDANAKFQTIGGGYTNAASGDDAAITGGEFNIATGYESTVSGGSANQAGRADGIVGVAFGARSFVGGGVGNVASGEGSVVVGGGTKPNTGADPYYGLNNTAVDSFAAVVGGTHNHANKVGSFIGGGDSNRLDSKRTAITGGEFNRIDTGSSYAAIDGGFQNEIDTLAPYAFIGGGNRNIVQSKYGTIAGGDSNSILSGSTHSGEGSFIGGGQNNIVGLDPDNDGDVVMNSSIVGGQGNEVLEFDGFIGGGSFNKVKEDWDVIGGGYENTVAEDFSFIGGGKWNLDSADYAVITGGLLNRIRDSSTATVITGGYFNIIDTNSDYSFIGGGALNYIQSSQSVLAGGAYNSVSTARSVIGGGDSNTIYPSSQNSVISGGRVNKILAKYDFIGGGQNNKIDTMAPYSVIVGGSGNTIYGFGGTYGTDGPIAGYGFIGGGRGNVIHADQYQSRFNVIVGGDSNWIDYGNYGAVIGGGKNNHMDNAYGVIAGGIGNRFGGGAGADVISGGNYNLIDGAVNFSVIAGGNTNYVYRYSDYSLVGGGFYNVIDSESKYSAIGGGRSNWIQPHTSTCATIPGGDNLIANEYAQAVVGFYNKASSTLVTDTASAATHGDEPLFIAGNGMNVGGGIVRHNAATISYNGHITATQTLGTAGVGPNATIMGTSYANNTIIAWGNVAVGAAGLSDGVGCTVAKGVGLGNYTIIVAGNVANSPSGLHSFAAGNSAVVATVGKKLAGMVAATIIVDEIPGAPGTYKVQTWDLSVVPIVLADFGFTFHVVSR